MYEFINNFLGMKVWRYERYERYEVVLYVAVRRESLWIICWLEFRLNWYLEEDRKFLFKKKLFSFIPFNNHILYVKCDQSD